MAVWFGVSFIGCSSEDADPPSEVGQTYTRSIGKAGGELATPSGRAVLSVLPGALDKDVTLTLKVLDQSGYADAAKLATPVYELGPDGTKFDKAPAVLTLDLGSKPASGGVVVAGYDASTKKWTQLSRTAMSGKYAVGWLDHFSAYAGWRTDTTPPQPITGVKVTPASLISQWPVNRGTIFRSEWEADSPLLTVEGTASPDGDGYMQTTTISDNKPATIPFKIKGGTFKFTFDARKHVSGPLIGKQGSAYFMLVVWCRTKCRGVDAGLLDAGTPPDAVPGPVDGSTPPDAVPNLDVMGGMVDMGKAASKIVISEIMANPNKVYDSKGEWFELYNPGPGVIDLAGWTVTDGKSQTFIIATSGGTTKINPGQYLVFGNNKDSKTNGGLTVHYQYPSSFGMYQTAKGDAVILKDKAGVEVDRVVWSYSTGWTIPTGASLSCKDFAKDNNQPTNWCAETSAWTGSAGDKGSPGTKRVCQ